MHCAEHEKLIEQAATGKEAIATLKITDEKTSKELKEVNKKIDKLDHKVTFAAGAIAIIFTVLKLAACLAV